MAIDARYYVSIVLNVCMIALFWGPAYSIGAIYPDSEVPVIGYALGVEAGFILQALVQPFPALQWAVALLMSLCGAAGWVLTYFWGPYRTWACMFLAALGAAPYVSYPLIHAQTHCDSALIRRLVPLLYAITPFATSSALSILGERAKIPLQWGIAVALLSFGMLLWPMGSADAAPSADDQAHVPLPRCVGFVFVGMAFMLPVLLGFPHVSIYVQDIAQRDLILASSSWMALGSVFADACTRSKIKMKLFYLRMCVTMASSVGILFSPWALVGVGFGFGNGSNTVLIFLNRIIRAPKPRMFTILSMTFMCMQSVVVLAYVLIESESYRQLCLVIPAVLGVVGGALLLCGAKDRTQPQEEPIVEQVGNLEV